MKKRPKRPIDNKIYNQTEDLDFDAATLDTAEKVIQFCENHGFKEGESTDIVKLIEDNPELEVSFEELGVNDAYIEKISDNKFRIVVNSEHPITRQRFSLAHEYAHYQLHRSKIDDMPHGEKIIYRNENRSSIEYEANEFAAEILMPSGAFKQIVRDENGIVSNVAASFGVSQLAVRYRAKSLGIGGHGL